MRGPGRMASPFLLSVLLLRCVGAWLDNRATAGACDESEITVVVALSSSLRAAGRGTIAGCYEWNNSLAAQDRPVYTKTAEGTTYAVLGSQASKSTTHGEPPWVIAQIHEPDSFMNIDGVARRGSVGVGVEVGVVGVEVEALVCTSGEDWWAIGSPSRGQGWKCETGGDGSLSAEEGSVSVSCGCLDVDEGGASSALGAMRVGGGGGGGGGSGGSGGGGGGASGNLSGVDQTAFVRRRRRTEVVAATDGSSNSSSNSDNSSSGSDISGFWSWIVISACVIGLTVLCCVGWYIRNPWCKSAPLGDPNASVEDAVPQAPKTAFQPWGASRPPK